MNRLVCLIAMALLGIGLTLAQNTKPSSDPSNSSNNASQAQSATPQQDDNSSASTPKTNQRRRHEPSQSAVPDPTIHDRQSNANSANDASGQKSNQASPSTMGTTGSTPPTPEEKQPATNPQNGTPPDQQPNSSTTPGSAPPHAELRQTPAARAVATHTPDPGTCMNPAALEVSAEETQAAAPPCR